jgi:hypothetical protein
MAWRSGAAGASRVRHWFEHNGERLGVLHRDGVAAGARIVGTVGRDGRDRLIAGDLRQQAGQHGRIAHAALGDLDRTHFHGRLVDSQVDLAPHAPLRPAMLARVPFALAAHLDPGAVHEQVKRTAGAPVGELHGQGLLPAAQRREIRHRPVEARELEQARDEAGRQWA